MLRSRVLTALVGLPLLLGALWAGGEVYLAVVAVLATASYLEASRMLSVPARGGSLALGLACVAGLLLTIGQGRPDQAVTVLTLYLLVMLGRQAVRYPAVAVGETSGAVLASLYIGLSFAHFPALRGLPGGLWLTLSVFVLTWAFDITAYFVGLAWGRHKMVPALSPGKSWEGAAGGAAAVLAVAAVPWPALPVPPWLRLAAGALVIIAGQLGDLAESSLKRYGGLKDSGRLLPGHGGLLDRFDSLIFVVPAAYYLFLWTLPRVPGV